jgi:hypothetical protein
MLSFQPPWKGVCSHTTCRPRHLATPQRPRGPSTRPLSQTPPPQSLANPYRRPVLGFREDLQAMGRAEVADFFAR